MRFKPQASWFPWLLFAAVMLHAVLDYILFDPLFYTSDESLLFITVIVILYLERGSILASLVGKDFGSPLFGFGLFSLGLVIFTFGRLSPVMILQVWGLFLMAAGLVAGLSPREYRRSSYFIALSGTVVVLMGRYAPNILSSELAVTLASLSAKVISATLFPVVADGVTLYFDQYSATVTKDCSGMNSIFSLTALSILYLRTGHKRKPWHIFFLVVSIIPVAVLTNFMRVMLVILATFYVGDWFAQSIFHETAGVFAFVLALLLLSLIDKLLLFVFSLVKPTVESSHATD